MRYCRELGARRALSGNRISRAPRHQRRNLTHWLISTQVARTTEFGGRVVRLLHALENDHERKEGTVALVSARMSMRACLDARLTGPVAERALAQTQQLAALGNLDARKAREMDVRALAPEQRLALQDSAPPRPRRRLAG